MGYFFALMPNAESVARLTTLAERLEIPPDLRVPPENYHVTLCFVGEIPNMGIAALRRIGDVQEKRNGPISLECVEFWEEPGVIVACSRQASRHLEALASSLANAAGHYRASAAQVIWRPHVTLMRKVSQAPVLQPMSKIEWTNESFCLMRSDKRGIKSAYTVVDAWSLLDEL